MSQIPLQRYVDVEIDVDIEQWCTNLKEFVLYRWNIEPKKIFFAGCRNRKPLLLIPVIITGLEVHHCATDRCVITGLLRLNNSAKDKKQFLTQSVVQAHINTQTGVGRLIRQKRVKI